MTNLRQMAQDEVIFRFESDEDKREFWELYIENYGSKNSNRNLLDILMQDNATNFKVFVYYNEIFYGYSNNSWKYPTWTEIKDRYGMKVKIIKCSDRDNSYGHLVGKVFEVYNSNHIVDGNCVYNVSNKDTVPVSEIRYELKSTVIYDTCVTSCEHKKNTRVGSVGCNKCEYNCGNDKEAQTVQCSWQDLEVVDTVTIEGFKGMKKSYVKEESKEMKRLDIRKDYEDKNIGIKPYTELKYYWIEIKNNGHDIMAIKLGAYGVSLDQVNAILKVLGLSYELYKSQDWSKVEEGAEVVFWLTCGNLKGQVRGKFNSYILNLKKVIVIVDDEVNVIDEDEVELC